MPDISNVRIGPASLVLGGVNIGHTMGGVTFHFERDETDLVVDKYGSTPVDVAISGQNATIETQLAEYTIDNLHAVLPETDLATNGSTKRLAFGSVAGTQKRQFAQSLVIHPLKNAATDYSEDITLYKVVPTENFDLAYTVDGQRVIPVTFRALVDETYGGNRYLGHVGPANIS